jgi:hypothetical protein
MVPHDDSVGEPVIVQASAGVQCRCVVVIAQHRDERRDETNESLGVTS